MVKTHLSTEEAAALLCRKPQTLQKWACTRTGLIKPVKVGRKLLWPVADIEALLKGGAA